MWRAILIAVEIQVKGLIESIVASCGTRKAVLDSSKATRHRVPELMTEVVAEVLEAESVSLMLLDRGRRELYIQAALGLDDEAIRDVRVGVGERISGHVAETGETLHVPDLAADGRFSSMRTSASQRPTLLSVANARLASLTSSSARSHRPKPSSRRWKPRSSTISRAALTSPARPTS